MNSAGYMANLRSYIKLRKIFRSEKQLAQDMKQSGAIRHTSWLPIYFQKIKKVKSACKPGSVNRSCSNHSSRTCIATHLKQPTREQRGPRQCSPIWSCSEWGLPCHYCYQQRGALLPHHFTLTHEKTWAVYFLWHWP